MEVASTAGRRRWPRRTLVLAGLLAASSCSGSSGGASDAIDSLAEKGVGAFAEGRWHCTLVEDDEHAGSSFPSTPVEHWAIIAIGADGRYSFLETNEAFADFGPGEAGTWSVEGLRLQLTVPWRSDGSHGIYHWTYGADLDPPTRLRGSSEDAGSVQDFEVDLGLDRMRLSQKDEVAELPEQSQPNYSWDVDCRRESHDPGVIPPVVSAPVEPAP